MQLRIIYIMLTYRKKHIFKPFKTRKSQESRRILKRYEVKKIGVYKVKIYDILREREIERIIREEKRGKRIKKYYLLECKKVYL